MNIIGTISANMSTIESLSILLVQYIILFVPFFVITVKALYGIHHMPLSLLLLLSPVLLQTQYLKNQISSQCVKTSCLFLYCLLGGQNARILKCMYFAHLSQCQSIVVNCSQDPHLTFLFAISNSKKHQRFYIQP